MAYAPGNEYLPQRDEYYYTNMAAPQGGNHMAPRFAMPPMPPMPNAGAYQSPFAASKPAGHAVAAPPSHPSSVHITPNPHSVPNAPPALAGFRSPNTANRATTGGPGASASAATTPHTPKVYTHNPYAPVCHSSSAGSFAQSQSMSMSASSSRTVGPHYNPVAQSTSAPLFDHGSGPAPGDRGVHVGADLSVQFMAAVGNLPATACTLAGSEMLKRVMSPQHEDNVELVRQEIMPHINVVAVDDHGCDVVRQLFRWLPTERVMEMIPFIHLETYLQMATKSRQTRSALLTLFEKHKSEQLMPVAEYIAKECVRFATDEQGCLFTKNVLFHARPEQRELIVRNLLVNFRSLAVNPYGNYVAQALLSEAQCDMNAVCNAFQGNWLSMCCNKYASHVMEKVVSRVDRGTRPHLLRELVLEPESLQTLLQDGFGNFVVQALIETSVNQQEFQTMYHAIAPQLHSSPFGHKIEAKLKDRSAKLFNSVVPPPLSVAEGVMPQQMM